MKTEQTNRSQYQPTLQIISIEGNTLQQVTIERSTRDNELDLIGGRITVCVDCVNTHMGLLVSLQELAVPNVEVIVLSLQNFANRSVWYLMCGKCWELDLQFYISSPQIFLLSRVMVVYFFSTELLFYISSPQTTDRECQERNSKVIVILRNVLEESTTKVDVTYWADVKNLKSHQFTPQESEPRCEPTCRSCKNGWRGIMETALQVLLKKGSC